MMVSTEKLRHKARSLKKCLLALGLAVISSASGATERFTEAVITQVETSDVNILVFLQFVSGDPLPQSDGGTNEMQKSFLFVANSTNDISLRKHVFTTAVVAQTQQTQVRFRWDDTNNRIVSMLLR